jgi:hypothetical protein
VQVPSRGETGEPSAYDDNVDSCGENTHRSYCPFTTRGVASPLKESPQRNFKGRVRELEPGT